MNHCLCYVFLYVTVIWNAMQKLVKHEDTLALRTTGPCCRKVFHQCLDCVSCFFWCKCFYLCYSICMPFAHFLHEVDFCLNLVSWECHNKTSPCPWQINLNTNWVTLLKASKSFRLHCNSFLMKTNQDFSGNLHSAEGFYFCKIWKSCWCYLVQLRLQSHTRTSKLTILHKLTHYGNNDRLIDSSVTARMRDQVP